MPFPPLLPDQLHTHAHTKAQLQNQERESEQVERESVDTDRDGSEELQGGIRRVPAGRLRSIEPIQGPISDA